MHWRRKWQPTPVFLPGESQGWRSQMGCHLWGHTSQTGLKRLSSSSSNSPLLQNLKQYTKSRWWIHKVSSWIGHAFQKTWDCFQGLRKDREDNVLCGGLCLVTQSCQTLCDPMDCSLPGSSVHGDSPDKNTGVGCYALLQGILPTQRLNSGLPHLQADSLLSEPWGKPNFEGTTF